MRNKIPSGWRECKAIKVLSETCEIESSLQKPGKAVTLYLYPPLFFLFT
jgi:hypothetical protein